MNPNPNTLSNVNTPASGLDLRRFTLVLFAHKWKIILWTLAGLLAAGYVYASHARVYESEAKLLVRYVVDRSSDPKADNIGYYRDNIVGTEMEILASWDLALKVAESVTPKRLLPNSPNATTAEAAKVILKGTTITSSHGSNVIAVSYRDPDFELSRLVLHELVTQYFEKHLEVHRSADTFDMVSQQTDQVRARLTQTEDELKRLKNQAGILSLAGNATSLDAQLSKATGDVQSATIQRLSQEAFVHELEKQLDGTDKKNQSEAAPRVPVDDAQRYKILQESIDLAGRKQIELSSKYTPDSHMVQLNREQLADLEAQRRALLAAVPGLATLARNAPGARAGTLDFLAEGARLAADEAREKATIENLDKVKKQVESFSAVETQIAQLERKKEMEEKNYMYFESSLEKARVDEALDPTKMPNISVVQKPSPPIHVIGEMRKLLVGLVLAGLGIGHVSAFLSGVVFDRSIKRPYELEELLRVPLLLSIPRLGLPAPTAKAGAGRQPLRLAAASIPTPAEILPFVEAVRDRLVLYFELNQMRNRPKLVGITGCARGAGVSTLASGLAASLSATGVGRILLVNMDSDPEKSCIQFEGQAPCSLAEAIESGTAQRPDEDGLVHTNGHSRGSASQLLPNRFYELVPSLRASEFTYIIFDMPPLDEGSIALALAGAMDHTVLVIEAERSQSSFVRRSYRELIAARAKVSTVLNKARTYGPSWMAAQN